MPKLKPYSLFTVLLLLGSLCKGQKDTLVKGTKYNYVDYYSNGVIKSLGHFNDSLKTGKWIYYKPNGQLLARGRYAIRGKYSKGYKIGRWQYCDYDEKVYKKRWKRRNQPGEELELKDGKLIIHDTTIKLGCIRGFVNGKHTISGHF